MTEGAPFDHDLKLARAAYHLKQLHTQIVEWRRQHRLVYRIQGDLNKGDELVVLASGENPGHDPLGLIVGDSIHNMRASLDLLAFALLRANHVAMSTPVPETLIKRSSFPIFNDPREFADRRETLIEASIAARNRRSKVCSHIRNRVHQTHSGCSTYSTSSTSTGC